ncbi:hypothetical protein SynRS9909_00953 [Synechococcus sp. RS9909]|nr:hypothetical protein SynRS9909_00953 [Synechococcus sp. RS9909]
MLQNNPPWFRHQKARLMAGFRITPINRINRSRRASAPLS